MNEHFNDDAVIGAAIAKGMLIFWTNAPLIIAVAAVVGGGYYAVDWLWSLPWLPSERG